MEKKENKMKICRKQKTGGAPHSVLLLACRPELQWGFPLFTKILVASGLHLHNV